MDNEIKISDYLNIIWRWRWCFVVGNVLGIACALIAYSMHTPPTHKMFLQVPIVGIDKITHKPLPLITPSELAWMINNKAFPVDSVKAGIVSKVKTYVSIYSSNRPKLQEMLYALSQKYKPAIKSRKDTILNSITYKKEKVSQYQIFIDEKESLLSKQDNPIIANMLSLEIANLRQEQSILLTKAQKQSAIAQVITNFEQVADISVFTKRNPAIYILLLTPILMIFIVFLGNYLKSNWREICRK